MNGIEAAFTGRIGKAPELRTSKSGKPWGSLNVAVDNKAAGEGEEGATTWVRVAVFGEMAKTVARLEKGARVYVEGSLQLNSWETEAGETRSGLNLAARFVQAMGQIGKRRPPPPKRWASTNRAEDWQAPLDRDQPNDPMPF